MPKVIPAASECDCDADVTYPPPDAREELPEFLARCSRHLTSLPPPIQRKWINNSTNINNSSSTNSSSSNDDERSSVINEDNNASESGEKIRVLQWNVLSQGEFVFLRYENNTVHIGFCVKPRNMTVFFWSLLIQQEDMFTNLRGSRYLFFSNCNSFSKCESLMVTVFVRCY